MLITTIHPSGKKIILVDKRALPKGTLFCEQLDEKLHTLFAAGKRVLIIGTKANFSSGMVCTDCGHIPRCKQCDLAVGRHKDPHGQLFGLCHLCKTYYPATNVCTTCQGHNFDLYGFGLQQIAESIKQTYQQESIIIDRSKVNSLRKIEKILPTLATSQCILATSLLSQPPTKLPIDLVIVTHADRGLQSPDLFSSRGTYAFLRELCTKYTSPEIRLHTYTTDHPSILHAIQDNHEAMCLHEHEQRKRFLYPPYADLCVIMYKHEIEQRVYTTVNKLYQELLFLKASYQQDHLEIYSTPPLIYKAFGKFRYHIVLKGEQLHPFIEIAYSKLNIASRGFKVDWEPQNLI